MKRQSGQWAQSAWVPVGLLSLAVWITFGPSVANDLTFDDRPTIVDNETIENLGNLRILFDRQEYFRKSDEYSYRPVVTLTYFLDHALAGKRPWVYHLHNVLLHHINVLLAFALFSTLGAGRWRSFAIALLFALHPLQTEAVLFPGFREDLQMATGLLAMSCCLAADRERPSSIWIVGAMAALAFALFAKEGALLVPLAWLAFDCMPDRPSQRPPLVLGPRYVPLALVMAAYVAVRFVVMTNPDAAHMDVIERLPLGQRFATAPHLFAYYLRRFLWPTPLCIINEIQPLEGLGTAFYVSLIVIAVAVGIWIALARRQPWLWLAGLWVAAAFAPVSNLYPIINLWAERFYYAANLGAAAVAVAAVNWAWSEMSRRLSESRRRTATWVACLLIGLLAWWAAICDARRIWETRTSLALWRATVRCVPENGNALISLAHWELQEKNFDRAEQLARKAESREGGGVFKANAVLGRSALRQKDWQSAIGHFQKALGVPPPSIGQQTLVALELAEAYVQAGQRQRALVILREAQKHAPENAAVRKRLAELEGRPEDAPTSPPVGVPSPQSPRN